MARCGVFCFLFLCVLTIVNVETKSSYSRKPSQGSHGSTHTSAVHHSSASHHTAPRPIEKHSSPSLHTSYHPTQTHNSHGYPSGTSPSRTVNHGAYPQSSGLSGTGNHVTSPPAIQPKVVSSSLANAPHYGAQGYPTGTSAPKSANYASYPVSNGLSGAQGYPGGTSAPKSASYPVSNGLSGSGNTAGSSGYPSSNVQYPGYPGGTSQPKPSYPQPNGLSGAGNQPSSGSHTYPTSFGKSGGARQPSSGGHTYPSSPGYSGGGSKPIVPTNYGQYPPHNTGTVNIVHTHQNPGHIVIRNQQPSIHTINIHTAVPHRYHYAPPPRFYYSTYSGRHEYPVYRGELPLYVYEYRSSNSRYSKLLAGLALYNLGRLSRSHDSYHFHNNYVPQANEICRFGVRDAHAVEEVDIDCRLITDFIFSQSGQVTATGTSNQILQADGSILSPNVVNALDPRFHGAPLRIHSNMRCYIKWSNGFIFFREKNVDCGLLQMYADKSLNSASKIKSSLLVIMTTATVLLYNFFY